MSDGVGSVTPTASCVGGRSGGGSRVESSLSRVEQSRGTPVSLQIPSEKGNGGGSDKKLCVAESDLSTSLLVEASEIENRLREHVLELLEPTIHKQRVFDTRLREVKRISDVHSEDILMLKRAQSDAAAKSEQVDNFRLELAGWDKERRTHEQQVGDRLSMQEVEINALRQGMEKKVGDEAALGRAVKGLGDTMETSKEEMAELRRSLMDRLDLNRDKLAKLRDEFETRVLAVESEAHRCVDNQISSDTRISHMKAELGRMSDKVAQVMRGIDDLDNSKASVNCVEAQQQEFSAFARQVSAHVSGLRQQFGGLVDDVKAHFQTAAQVVSSSTAEQMESMRDQYRAEMKRMDELVKEIDAFMANQKGTSSVLKANVEKYREEARSDIQSLRDTTTASDASRKHQLTMIDTEVQQLRSSVKKLETSPSGHNNASLAQTHLVSLLIDSQMLGCAMERQDNIDRKSISLFGYKSESAPRKESRLPEINCSGKATSRTPRNRSVGGSPTMKANDCGQVLSLDSRCLSCSGNVGATLAGFKLACLNYSPSSVEFERAIYTREELLNMQMDLLDQAKEQLRSAD
eukprot:TRINITY_DN14737_c0_g1_i1.p1 TRINITY_DN14737_c0_g1~~TRINITY_DN14737_c0_g1_i1.p1  ORF type:complete len:577 (-),score=124.68 TRINITY_DN14737_c0_g1_i1:127-1857(-)